MMEHETAEEMYKRLFPYCHEPFLEYVKEHQDDEAPKRVVYVLEFSNNTVKIGVTQDIERRKKTLCGASGLEIKREWNTGLLEHKIAYKIESLSHDELKPYRTRGEYFAISFDDACFTVALYGIIVSEGEKIEAARRQAQ